MTLKMGSYTAPSNLQMQLKIVLISLITISLVGCSVNAAEFNPSSIEISLNEHKTDKWDPEIFFSKQSESIIRVSSTVGSIGSARMFISVSKDYIHNKFIRIKWHGWSSWSGWFHTIRVYDGTYDRSSDIDFPSGSFMSLKGNGLLQKGITRSGAFGPVTEEFLVDVSGASLDSVTIFIASRDAWIAQNGWLQVDMLEINTGAGGSGTLWRETFTGSIHMEKTDSTGDYGYLASGPPDFVIPEFPLGTISAIAAGLIALLIAGRRPRTFQRN